MTRDELLEEDEYDDILKEVEEELEAKYGKLAAIVMPQPSKKGPANDPAGVGLVFVRFEELPRAVRPLFPAMLAFYQLAILLDRHHDWNVSCYCLNPEQSPRPKICVSRSL